MPAFVKTPHDEELWSKAKASAKQQGKAEDWAYITGIFKKMKGGKVASEEVVAFRWMDRQASDYAYPIEKELKPLEAKIAALLKPVLEKILEEGAEDSLSGPAGHHHSEEDDEDAHSNAAGSMVFSVAEEVRKYLTEEFYIPISVTVHGHRESFDLGFMEV